MARRLARGRFVRPPKKTVLWVGNTPRAAPVVVGASTAILDSVLNAVALALRPFTILRARGLIFVSSDQTGASEVGWNGFYSQIVVTDNATAAGINSIPEPISEPDASFFNLVPFAGDFTFVTGSGFAKMGSTFSYDSKAMRKVGNNDDIASVISNNSAAFGIQVIQVGRLLVQLH